MTVIASECFDVPEIGGHEFSTRAHVQIDVMEGRGSEIMPGNVFIIYPAGALCKSESSYCGEWFEYDAPFMEMRDLDYHVTSMPTDDIGLLSFEISDLRPIVRILFHHIGFFHGRYLL